jgi:hypothetical protein
MLLVSHLSVALHESALLGTDDIANFDNFLFSGWYRYRFLPEVVAALELQLNGVLLALSEVHGCFIKMDGHLFLGEHSISKQKVKS